MHAPRARWVIAELDVRGEIDDHAAMCLAFGVAAAREDDVLSLVVDLRELNAIDDHGIGLFLAHDAACRAAGVGLEILVCTDARQRAIVSAFTAAGLGDRLRSREPAFPAAPPPAAPRPVRVSARPATARR
jgi:anti-anti-sigma regulatory factor